MIALLQLEHLKGILNSTFVPTFSTESSVIDPLRFSVSFLHTLRPRPIPCEASIPNSSFRTVPNSSKRVPIFSLLIPIPVS
jgi:hypothetical protein